MGLELNMPDVKSGRGVRVRGGGVRGCTRIMGLD